VATSTPDQPQPATACIVQQLIGPGTPAAFDLNAVCSGFVFGCHGVPLLTGGGYGLVIGADVYSRILDPRPADRRACSATVPVPPCWARCRPGTVCWTPGWSATRPAWADRSAAGGSRLPASAETLAPATTTSG